MILGNTQFRPGRGGGKTPRAQEAKTPNEFEVTG